MANNTSTPPETKTAEPAADTTVAAESKTKTVAPKTAARRRAATSPKQPQPVATSASKPATAASTAKKATTRPAVGKKRPPANEAGHEPKPFIAKDAKAKKPAKTKKAKLVRDSFAMPDGEHKQIATLKKRCLDAGVRVKKSEILRAALANLVKLSDSSVLAAVRRLETTKTARPSKVKGSK